jgi:hypothetical protein
MASHLEGTASERAVITDCRQGGGLRLAALRIRPWNLPSFLPSQGCRPPFLLPSQVDTRPCRSFFLLTIHSRMPSVEVDLPMGDTFIPYRPGYMSQNQPFLQDSYPPYSPSSVYSRTSRSYGSLSFLPSTVYRSESADQSFASSRRATERAPVYISPFRSVRQMKEPFQLKLPSSPSCEPSNNPSSKEQPRTLQSPIGFRPLRSCRSDQHLVAGALESFGLLPSPSLSDSRIPSKPNVFPPKQETESDDNKGALTKCSCTPPDRLCELCVVSSYEGQTATRSTNPSEDTDMIMGTPNVDGEGSGESEEKQEEPAAEKPLPQEPLVDITEALSPEDPCPNPTSTPLTQFTESKSTPGSSGKSKKRTRTGTVSSAASWAPGDLTYCESWLQGVSLETPERKDEKAREANRRKCQIVQQTNQSRKPVNLRIDTQAANHSVVCLFPSSFCDPLTHMCIDVCSR